MAMSRSLAGTLLTSRPSIESLPAVMVSSPAIMRSVVDLPQPDGPSSTMNSPSLIVKIDVIDRRSCMPRKSLAHILQPHHRHRHRSFHLTAPAVMPWMSFSEKNA